MTDRERFEAWCKSRSIPVLRSAIDDGQYWPESLHRYWEVWQAAITSLTDEARKEAEEMQFALELAERNRQMHDNICADRVRQIDAQNRTIEALRSALRQAELRKQQHKTEGAQ